MITRRALFGFLAAPAIVRAASLMPVRRPPLVMAGPVDLTVIERWQKFNDFDLSTREQRVSLMRTAYEYFMSQPARYDFARAA